MILETQWFRSNTFDVYLIDFGVSVGGNIDEILV